MSSRSAPPGGQAGSRARGRALLVARAHPHFALRSLRLGTALRPSVLALPCRAPTANGSEGAMGVTGEPAARAPALRRGCGVRRTPQRVPAADAAAAAAAGAAAGRPAVTARNGAAAAEAQAARIAGCRAPAPHSGPPHHPPRIPGLKAWGKAWLTSATRRSIGSGSGS